MKRLILLALMLMATMVAQDFDLDAKSKKKKAGKKGKVEMVDKAAVKSKKVSKYEKTFIKDKTCETASCEGGFMTVHKVKGKLYLELPLEYLGREMLIASTVTKSSDSEFASIGYKPSKPLHVRFTKVDSTIFMNEVAVLPDYDEQDRNMAKAVELTGMDPILNSWKMTCWNKDSTAVVFDVTTMLSGDYEKLAPVKTKSGLINTTASYNSVGRAIEGIKAFKDNVTVKSVLSYTVTTKILQLVTLKNKVPVSVGVTRTILLLPEKKMRSRMADTRVGIFLSGKVDLDADVDAVKQYSVINRWNVQPSDTAAWLRGELVEPVKPIVFYVDDALPEPWREPAKRGVLRWNKAFEAIGFKNVLQVRDFPTDDPEFDPDNLKYSCIRYIPSQVANAMGPSWVDPTTGEIINASVIVWNDVIRLINNWRFVQTSQVDERVRAKRMPADVVDESIEYVIAHEIGHCLGFMHNMSASAAYAVESLRDPEFTRKNGTTSSIMDYARFNYVAQPEDKDVNLNPPYLGAYDYFLVKYAYCPVPDASTMKEEVPVLESWVDEKAGDPIYRYGRQQVSHRYDPSAIEEDLGDDPVKAAEYGVKNLKYILSHFNEWMPDEVDKDASLKAARYEALVGQYNRYLKGVMLNIGGIYLTEVKPGTVGDRAKPVSRERQQAAMKWVLNEIRNCGWVEDRSVTEKFPMRLGQTPVIQYNTLLELFDTHKNVILSSYLAGNGPQAYTLRNWLDDIYKDIWASTIRSATPGSCDRMLQNLHVTFLTGAVQRKSSLTKAKSLALSDDGYLPSVDHMVLFGLDESGVLAENIDFLRRLEEVEGHGYVAGQMALDKYGPSGYRWQSNVNTRAIDESKSLLYGEVKRVEKLLLKAVSSSKGDVRAHYESMLYRIQSSIRTDK